MFYVWYIITCMLHTHSKPLELAWEEVFGEFGIGNKTSSQFSYACWYVQNNLGSKFFKKVWKRATQTDWVGDILPQPVLSRWGYLLKTATMVYTQYDNWVLFHAYLYQCAMSNGSIYKTAKDALALGKNAETRVHLCFLAAFGQFYWTSGYNWLCRIDKTTKLDGHSSHEALQFVFYWSNLLSKLERGQWKTHSDLKSV